MGTRYTAMARYGVRPCGLHPPHEPAQPKILHDVDQRTVSKADFGEPAVGDAPGM